MTQMVSLKDKMGSVRELLERMKPQLELALPRHMTADRMVRIALTSLQRTPQLLDCDKPSLAGAILQSAQLGLEPDGVLGHAYLVPFKGKVVFIPGYKGLIQLARRSGEVSTVEAVVVNAGDVFEYERGLVPILRHKPAEGDAGKVTHVYAIIRLRDGGVQWDVMTFDQIEAVRRRSPAGNGGPWVTDWPEMAKKTVLKRVLKLAPCSVEAQRAIALDERAEAGIDQNLELIDLPPTEAPQLAESLADA